MTEINFKRLTVEVKAFERYLEPTRYESSCREDIVRKFRQHALKHIPTAQVCTFGSCETKLLLPNSDVDIAINYPSNDGIPAKSIIRKIRKGLYYLDLQVECVIPKATVPLIKCIDRRSQLGVDIAIQPNISSSDRTLKWIKEHTELKPLFLVIKHSLSGIRLELDSSYMALDSSRGGVASYVLICLIVHYLKYNERAKSFVDPATRLGQLLYGFLQFYSTFNFEKTGLKFSDTNGFFDVANNATFTYPEYTMKHRMIIENLDEPGQNVARACMTARKFQAVLSWMHGKLKSLIEQDELQPSLLTHIVAVKVLDPDVPRKNLLEYKIPVIYLSNDALSNYVSPSELSMMKNPKKRASPQRNSKVDKPANDQRRGKKRSWDRAHGGQSGAEKKQRKG